MQNHSIIIIGIAAVIGVVVMLSRAQSSGAASAPPSGDDSAATFTGSVYNEAGELVGPIALDHVRMPVDDWRDQLTAGQFRILRERGTERSGTGHLLHNQQTGVYTCAGCGLPLFDSDTKFESGTGWPSFFRPIATGNIAEKVDRKFGMTRTEVLCPRCEGHLGHVFNDGPRPTGLRYCLNSAALDFTPIEDLIMLADPAADETMPEDAASSPTPALASVVIAGGCFWCVEAVFEELAGVHEAVSGYAGGTKATANYREVCSGRTGHAEAVRIVYDPNVISYVELLEVHFATHDPTQINRQGNDHGPQYRTALFYASDEEKALAEAFIADVNEQKIFSRPVATTLEPLTEFYEAEYNHQNYVCNNPTQGYVRGVALPKVEKVRKLFKDKLKDTSPLDAGR